MNLSQSKASGKRIFKKATMSDNHKVVVFANNNPSTAESNDFSFGNDNDSASGETSGSTGNASSEMNNSNGGYVTSGLAKEERWVSMARALVFAVMVTAATIVGVETFRISTKQQLDNFINDVSYAFEHGLYLVSMERAAPRLTKKLLPLCMYIVPVLYDRRRNLRRI